MKKIKSIKYAMVGIFLLSGLVASAHPSPVDFLGMHRHELGSILAFIGATFSILFYVYVGSKKTSRAKTVSEYFLYDKNATIGEYVDTTVGYSFQVAVTVYFIFWGYKYGIFVSLYAVQWIIGLMIFRYFSPKLMEFVKSNNTLHSFLASKYGVSSSIRRLTAICTIVGLLGGLLVEVSYTTDVLTSLSTVPISNIIWAITFLFFVGITLMYVRFGGYKATAITAQLQLPIIYVSLSIIFLWLVAFVFEFGSHNSGLYIGIILTILWAIIAQQRKIVTDRNNIKFTNDRVLLISLVSAVLMVIELVYLYYHYKDIIEPVSKITNLAPAFSWRAFEVQDNWVFLSFLILNCTWQFFDMSAWQRIASVDIKNLDESNALKKIKSAISETVFESPITWMFGILFGIILRSTSLFNNDVEPYMAFNSFVQILYDNDFSAFWGMTASYIVLPALIVALVGIMLSTTDSFLTASIFAWVFDLSGKDPEKELQSSLSNSSLMHKANKIALILLLSTSVLFILLYKYLSVNIFLAISTIYSAQFVISFFTFGALLLKEPPRYKTTAILAVVVGLTANIATAVYCYLKMQNPADSAEWTDLFYVYPTLICALSGTVVYISGIAIQNIYGRLKVAS